MARRDDDDDIRYTSAREVVESHTNEYDSTVYKLPPDTEKFEIDKVGLKRLDIMPYRVGRGNRAADPGMVHWELTFFTHRGIGPDERQYVCPAKMGRGKCPVCEDAARMRRDPDANDDLIKALKPRERQLFNVLDLDDAAKGIQVWEISFHNFGKMLYARIDASDDTEDGYAYFFRLKGGLTLKVNFIQESFAGQKFFEASSIDFKPRAKDYSKDWLDAAHCLEDLLIILPYEKLRAIYYQEPEDGAGGGETAAPPRRSPAAKPAAAAEEEEPWELDEEDTQPPPREPAAAPKRRPAPPDNGDVPAPTRRTTAPARRAPAPVEEEEVGDFEEEAPAPVRPKTTAPAKRRPAPTPPPEEEEVGDFEEEAPAPARTTAPAKRAPAPAAEEADDEDWGDWEDEEEAAAPAPARAKRR